jgi:glucoamylase
MARSPTAAPYDGTGEGRCWPILTGERGHYELAAGRDPRPFIEAMEKFANEGGMLPEQLWDADDLPDGKMKRGGPTGSAMPLCWAHAEYVTLGAQPQGWGLFRPHRTRLSALRRGQDGQHD